MYEHGAQFIFIFVLVLRERYGYFYHQWIVLLCHKIQRVD